MKTSAKIILFPQETKKGFPLKLRITQNRKSTYIRLNYYLTRTEKSKYWNSDTNTLRASYPHYQKVQNVLDNALKSNKIELKDEESVKTYINNRSFLKYLDERLESYEITGKYGSIQKLKTVRLHLKDFKAGGDILFGDINLDFLNEFKLFLYKRNVKAISQKAYFERIRKLINDAIKEDKYNPKKHPFTSFEFDKSVIAPKSLTIKEFDYLVDSVKGNRLVINTKTNVSEILYLSPIAKDAGLKFIFQYYAYGMRVSDLITLRWNNFYEFGRRLRYTMFKTKNDIDIQLSDGMLYVLFHFLPKSSQIKITKLHAARKNEESEKSRTITNASNNEEAELKYNPITNWYQLISSEIHNLSIDNSHKNKYVFNMIPPEEFTDKQLYYKIQNSTSLYNLNLKQLAEEVFSDELKFKLCSHTARHTFADIARLRGTSIYDISKALNHKSISTTEKYLNNFKSNQLDNIFFNKITDSTDKNKINARLRELLNSSDDKIKAIMVQLYEQLLQK